MKYLTLKKWSGTLVITAVVLCLVVSMSGCGKKKNTNATNESTNISATETITESTEATITESPEATADNTTAPLGTGDASSTTETSDTPTPPKTYMTMYTTTATNYHTGPGSTYEKKGSLAKGASVQVVEGSKTEDGWYEVLIQDEHSYMHADNLSQTPPSQESASTDTNADSGSDSGSNSGGASSSVTTPQHTVGPADTSTGISWDGVSPIIYTYPDGTTGTEPVEGATYEKKPGVISTYKVPRDRVGRPIGTTCETCGKNVACVCEGTNCVQYTKLTLCSDCGQQVEAYTCHTCETYVPDVSYCRHCGKVHGNGSNGTCIRWLMAGNYTCPSCGETVPGRVCHTCKDD